MCNVVIIKVAKRILEVEIQFIVFLLSIVTSSKLLKCSFAVISFAEKRKEHPFKVLLNLYATLLVSVMIRFVRSFWLYADVAGLLGGEAGELYT